MHLALAGCCRLHVSLFRRLFLAQNYTGTWGNTYDNTSSPLVTMQLYKKKLEELKVLLVLLVNAAIMLNRI